MNARALILVGLAVLIAFGTIRFAKNWLASQRAALAAEQPRQKAEQPDAYVLVAAKELPTGSFVRAEDLRWQAWPDVDLNENYLRKGKVEADTLTGAVVRSHIAAGEPIIVNRLIKPGDRGFLAAVLSPGMRAVTVPVTETSGVGGLVFPGDRVDLILSHLVKISQSAGTPAHSASETVLTNLRVLAVDQTTDSKDGKPVLGKTITFEATPKQVEVIEVAAEIGKLSLSLRSISGAGEEKTASTNDPTATSYTWDSDVSPLLRPQTRPAAATVPTVTILRGDTGRAGARPSASLPMPMPSYGASPGGIPVANAAVGTAGGSPR